MSITLKMYNYISFHLLHVFLLFLLKYKTNVFLEVIPATEEVCAQNVLSHSLNSFLFPTIMDTECRVIVRQALSFLRYQDFNSGTQPW